jgi:hypothetical protein
MLDLQIHPAILNANLLQRKKRSVAMTEVTPESIRQFFEQAASAYGDAWKAQVQYYESLVRRNTKAFTDLADARVSSFREIREAKTFNQAFEANLAFEEKVREEFIALGEANTQSWEHLLDELKGIYTPAKEAAKAPAKEAAKAPAKKPAAKKTAVKKTPAKSTTKVPVKKETETKAA